MTATTAVSNTANITKAMMAGIITENIAGDVSTVPEKMESVIVWFWTPNMLVTLQVYAKLLISIGISVSSSKDSVPSASRFPFMSSHSIVSTVKSVVQLRVAEDPYGRGDSCPVILIPDQINYTTSVKILS